MRSAAARPIWLAASGAPAAALGYATAAGGGAAGGAPSGALSALLAAAGGLVTRADPAYATHTPLTPLERGAVGVLSLLGAFNNPRRADLVAASGETTGLAALQAMRDRMLRSTTGRQLLRDRPRVTNEAVAHAWDLPEHTFGGAYARFMGDRNFQADERPPVRFIDDPELAWVAARSREVHDFWHVLFGCHTNVFGEVALKAVEFVQTGLPMAGLAVLAGEWRLASADRALLNRVYLPWALRAGARCADLITLPYERHLGEDLEELRMRWRIEPAPAAPQNTAPGGVAAPPHSAAASS